MCSSKFHTLTHTKACKSCYSNLPPVSYLKGQLPHFMAQKE
uniref:Uncharacterized protein n=1 Tax=Rhizophora mucronata TaxID=61149 RepID=A0A2P2QGT3_RHIMU